MERKAGSTFCQDGKTYMVVEDKECLNRRSHCDAPCSFKIEGRCAGSLIVTGDCKGFYRSDKKSVYFVNCDETNH